MALALAVAALTAVVLGVRTVQCSGAASALVGAAGSCTSSPSDAARVLVALAGGLAVVVLLRRAVRARD